MLSFGQYHLPYPGQGSISTNPQFQYSGFTPYSQASSAQTQQHQVSSRSTSNTNLPLTPPGSPEDEAPLVICDSPQKTPPKQRFSAVDGGDNEIVTGASGLNSCSHQSTDRPSLPYAGSLNSATATALVCVRDLDSSSFYDTRAPSVYSCGNSRRSRNEKKAVPELLKDDKYFERRRRNNAAAKKSRDTRKNREDEISTRAAFLEKENAVLRAQVTTLREEAHNLRLLLLQKRERQLSTQADMSGSASTFGTS